MTVILKNETSFGSIIKTNPLIPILKFYWPHWILAFCLLVAAAALTLSIPLAFKDIIDAGAESKKLDEKFLHLFVLSVLLAIFLFGNNMISLNITKVKKGLKYLFPAVLITYFIGTFSLLNLLSNSEKISVIIFLQSVLSLLLVATLSYVFLQEKLSFTQIIGVIIGLIGTGIIIFNSDIHKKN